MIRRLRKKFVLLCMGVVVAVMVAVVALMNGLFLARANASLDGMLAFLADNGGDFPAGDGEETPLLPRGPRQQDWGGVDVNSPEAPFITRHFSVLLDESGEALDINTDSIAAVSSEEAVLYAQRALDKADSGYLGVYRYRVAAADEGALVVFLDASTQLATARQFLVISGAVALGVCLAVFLLALLFSGRAVRPIAQSVEKQRQFITDAGHELKTPLTIISANCEVLEMEMEKNEWLTGIEKQVARLRKLVNDLVALSRLDEGRPMDEEARFSLSDAVCDTALAFSAAAERAGKRLRVEVEPAVFVTGDEAALRQLTAILVDNAVKYADAGGEVTVCLRGGRHPVLTVENDCRNVDELPLQRLFDRFYRFDPARTGDGSHGLGLSIARSIAETHRAALRAEKAGEGRIRMRVRL